MTEWMRQSVGATPKDLATGPTKRWREPRYGAARHARRNLPIGY